MLQGSLRREPGDHHSREPGQQRAILQEGCGAVWVLAASCLLRSLLIGRVQNPATRYNLKRIVDLAVALLIFFIVVSLLFVNWYAAVVSLGVASLILGLALQNPITSFFGWVYILVRKPYEVGDRIKIGSATGDVIELMRSFNRKLLRIVC